MIQRLALAIPLRRTAVDLAVFAAGGWFLGFVGPFDTGQMPLALRYLYWLMCIVGGGLIGVAIDTAFGVRLRGFWIRLIGVSLAMTPLVTALVIGVGHLLVGRRQQLPDLAVLGSEVFVISVVVMAVRALTWREGPTVVETRTVIEAPLPAAEAAFRRRLTAKRRGARLIAVEAYDHYLRVHTDAGSELVTLRFADALKELAGAHGLQVHRSWWVAADAIEAVQWRRGGGEARLACDVVAPVSRSHAPALKAAGWF